MGERVLAVQFAKLGDFIQSLPLLAALRAERPDMELVLAAEQPAVAEAAKLWPLADRVATPEEAAGQQFDRVFVLNSHPRAAQLAARVKTGRLIGPRLENGRLRFTPAQDFLMALMARDRTLGRFNLVDVWLSLAPGAAPPARSLRPPREGTGFRVGLQLGARHHLRRWPVEHFVRLTGELAALRPDFTPVLLGSREERPLGARFEKLRGPGRPEAENLLGATDLAGLAEALAGLDLLITADTGVLHLAAALGVPALALFFGPAYGPETGPYGPGHLIYQAAAPCAPCREDGRCRRRQCLEMPRPDLAARLAADFQSPGPDLPEFPPGHRLWRTAADAFGQRLEPLGRPVPDGGEALALLVTEAGRTVLRPGYRADPASLAGLLAAYDPGPGRPAAGGRILDDLARLGFPGRPESGRLFRETAGRLAREVGLEIA